MAQIDTGIEVRKVSEATPGLGSKRIALKEIPLVDLSPLQEGDDDAKAATAEALRRACIDIGFFYIENHGVPKRAIDTLYEASRGFFDLDVEHKMEVDIAKSSFGRGYIPLCGEKNNSKSMGDLKETFDMAIEIAAEDPDYRAGNPALRPQPLAFGIARVQAGDGALLQRDHGAQPSALPGLCAGPWVARGLLPANARQAPR